MGLQNKLSKFFIKSKRKLFDMNIHIQGVELDVIRLKVTEDGYGDKEVEVISNDELVIIIDLPEEIPLTRLRDDITSDVASTNSVFLYDILPILGFAKFDDNIEKGDIFIYKFYFDSNNINNVKYLILEATEILGNIDHQYLTWKKLNCSPYTQALPVEVQTIVDNKTTD